jgi:hypothetical protein
VPEPVLIPSGKGWNPSMRALTLLAVQQFARETGEALPLSAADVAYVRDRPPEPLLRMAAQQRVIPRLISSLDTPLQSISIGSFRLSTRYPPTLWAEYSSGWPTYRRRATRCPSP